MIPAPTPQADAVQAAAFLIQVLELDAEPAELMSELARLAHDAVHATFTAELDSSAGPAAFLIYLYDLAAQDATGRTGATAFAEALATLETAAARDAPGPRLLAHASTAERGFLLATTPAVYRALSGQAPLDTLQASPGDLLPAAEFEAVRRDGPLELLRLLRAANAQATAWLTAIQGEGQRDATADRPESAGKDLLTFTAAETELALYLFDETSIQALLRAVNLLLTAARQSTAAALAESDPDGEPPSTG